MRSNQRCGDRLNDDNVNKCVKLRGLPYTITKQQVVEFFTGFEVRTKDVTMDLQNSKPTGYAMVEMVTGSEAVRAVQELNRKEIGSRWIGVTHAEMRGQGRKD